MNAKKAEGKIKRKVRDEEAGSKRKVESEGKVRGTVIQTEECKERSGRRNNPVRETQRGKKNKRG